MGGFVKIGRSNVWRDDFNESDHPRAKDGKFGSDGGSSKQESEAAENHAKGEQGEEAKAASHGFEKGHKVTLGHESGTVEKVQGNTLWVRTREGGELQSWHASKVKGASNPAKAGAEAARSEGNPQDRLNKAMKAHETLKRQYHNDYDGDFNSPEAKKVKGELDKAKAEMETAQAEVKNGSEGKKIVRKGLFSVDYEKVKKAERHPDSKPGPYGGRGPFGH